MPEFKIKKIEVPTGDLIARIEGLKFNKVDGETSVMGHLSLSVDNKVVSTKSFSGLVGVEITSFPPEVKENLDKLIESMFETCLQLSGLK